MNLGVAGTANPNRLLDHHPVEITLVLLIAMARSGNEVMPREGLLTAAYHTSSFHISNTNWHFGLLSKD